MHKTPLTPPPLRRHFHKAYPAKDVECAAVWVIEGDEDGGGLVEVLHALSLQAVRLVHTQLLAHRRAARKTRTGLSNDFKVKVMEMIMGMYAIHAYRHAQFECHS